MARIKCENERRGFIRAIETAWRAPANSWSRGPTNYRKEHKGTRDQKGFFRLKVMCLMYVK